MAAAGGGPGRIRVERPLAQAEVTRRIREGGWAVMTVVEGDRPYAVPMAYGYDGRLFFVASAPGRKRRALERAPLVCLTIVDPPSHPEAADYVVVLGRARPITSPMARLRAGFLILRRFAHGWPALKDLRRMARGRIFRIEPQEISGAALSA